MASSRGTEKKLDLILEKLSELDRRMIAVERNVDLLVENARVHNVVRATVTPIPRAVGAEE